MENDIYVELHRTVAESWSRRQNVGQIVYLFIFFIHCELQYVFNKPFRVAIWRSLNNLNNA